MVNVMHSGPEDPTSNIVGGPQTDDLKNIAKLSAEHYRQLQIVARSYMRRERKGHTYQPTALLNEALARLCAPGREFENRQHFYATCARQMRHILVDHAKARRRIKRGGADQLMVKDYANIVDEREDGVGMIEIDDLLTQFEQVDDKSAQAFELHYFGGLTIDETAGALGLSHATVQRRIRIAKAWLLARLQPPTD